MMAECRLCGVWYDAKTTHICNPMTSVHEPYRTETNPHGIRTSISTAGMALDPRNRKRKTIALLEQVQRGEVTPKKAFELLKELV